MLLGSQVISTSTELGIVYQSVCVQIFTCKNICSQTTRLWLCFGTGLSILEWVQCRPILGWHLMPEIALSLEMYKLQVFLLHRRSFSGKQHQYVVKRYSSNRPFNRSPVCYYMILTVHPSIHWRACFAFLWTDVRGELSNSYHDVIQLCDVWGSLHWAL